MSIELPNESNQANFVLEAEATTQESNPVDLTQIYSTVSFDDAVLKPSYTANNPGYSKVSSPLTEKIIVWDTETTGTNPWDDRLLVVSFWDLSKPISEMVTFEGWDEEKLTMECADYLNSEQPTALVCYNNGFDQRHLLSRCMLYQIPIPGWNNIKQIDIMDILKKGSTQSMVSSQATGTEEQWFQYLFNESKPYTIEECFEGVREGDLTRLILRNRTCVESEGSIYLAFRFVTDEEPFQAVEAKPTAMTLDEARSAGICAVTCPACDAVNTVPCSSKDNQCFRCLGRLPDPTSANVIKEVLREVDYTKVGLK